jgi:hypothetical protein
MGTSDRGLSHPFKGSGASQDGVGPVSLRCQLELNTSGILSVLADKNINNWSWANVGLHLESGLRTYIDINFFLCFGVGNSLLAFVQAF